MEPSLYFDLFSYIEKKENFSIDFSKAESKYSFLNISRGLDFFYLISLAEKLTQQDKEFKFFFVSETKEKSEEAYNIFKKTAQKNNFEELNNKIFLYPDSELYPFEKIELSLPIASRKASVLNKILKNKDTIIFSSFKALFDPILTITEFKEFSKTLKIKDKIKVKEFLNYLQILGFKRVQRVESIGEFSLRGNIIDLYIDFDNYPVRIVIEEDKIIRIKRFDPISQISKELIDEIEIFPLFPILFDKFTKEKLIKKVELNFENYIKEKGNTLSKEAFNELGEKIEEDLIKLQNQENFSGLNFYTLFSASNKSQNFLYPSISSYFKDAFFFFDTKDINSLFEDFKQTVKDAYKKSKNANEVFEVDLLENFGDLEYKKFFTPSRVFVLNSNSYFENTEKIDFNMKDVSRYNIIESFYDYFKKIEKAANKILVITENKERVSKLFEELNINFNFYGENAFEFKNTSLFSTSPGVYIKRGFIKNGFQYEKIVFLSDFELFPQEKEKVLKKKILLTEQISRLEDLKEGDYVVHREFGIGIFKGIKTIKRDSEAKDFLFIQYENDVLYTPLERMSYVEKYIGDKSKIVLGKSTSKFWKNVSKKAREETLEIARKLLKTAALRKTLKAISLKPNEELEKIIEDSFPFEETEDQKRAIFETFNELENSETQDILICGDVGYGKTEVAIRASFRAVVNGMQACFLCPTTILAMQHYRNFKERFEDIGVKIGLLSRMVSKKEEKETIQNLKEGKIDIIIGTHKVLSKKVEFKNLGILIIDEEQLFGVKDKEKIKEMRTNIHVLTLTATPIPRTLESALIGLKKVFTINTPPFGREPVKTFLMPYNDEVLKNALSNELERSGQVYYVHNKIQDLETVESRIRKLSPMLRIGVAHGRMNDAELENIMVGFYENSYDLLLSTTIIEAGLDFPNVNTIIIDDAQNLGLAQLYQLRGRVGRSTRRSYAYFFYDKRVRPDSLARERLEAIENFQDLGSGFKIAIRDLELRGAGNILGIEQSGNMYKIGYHYFISLLERAILELRGEKIETPVEPKIDLKIQAYIPEDFIENQEDRLEIYKKLLKVEASILPHIKEELEDIYGKIPNPTENLLRFIRIKDELTKRKIYSLKEFDKYFVFEGKEVQFHHSSILEGLKHLGYAYKILRDSFVVYKDFKTENLRMIEEIIKIWN